MDITFILEYAPIIWSPFSKVSKLRSLETILSYTKFKDCKDNLLRD